MSEQRNRKSVASGPGRSGADVEDIDFGPLLGYLGYHLRRVQQAYKKHFLRAAAGFDVQPREVGPIFLVGLNPGLTPSRLGAALAWDGSQVATLLKEWELRGLVERRVSDTDGRSRALHLTAAGRSYLKRISEVVAGLDNTFIGSRLNAAETRQLIDLLSRLIPEGEPTRD